MKTIYVSINQEVLVPDQILAGRENDNNATQLLIQLPDDWYSLTYTYRLLFATPKTREGEVHITNPIEADENKCITFIMPDGLMYEGELKVQLRAYDPDGMVVHTAIMYLLVAKSLEGDPDESGLPPNYAGLLEQTLADANVTIQRLGDLEEDLIFKRDNGFFTGPKGDQGPQGVSGVYIGPSPPPDWATVWIRTDIAVEKTSMYNMQECDARFARALIATAAGPVAHADDMLDGSRLRRAAICGVTTETGTGDKGPGNPCTISGATPTALTIDDGTHTQTLHLPTLDPLYGDGTVMDEYDMVTGALTRRWGRVLLDGTERWSGQADGAAYLLPIPGKYQRYGMDGLVCSHYPTRGTTQPYHGIDNNWGSLRFWVTAEHATLADWQAYLATEAAAGRPVTVLYELAEPVVIQLESQTIIPPAPVCNLYADAGTVAIEYQRDPTIAYDTHDRRLAALEAALATLALPAAAAESAAEPTGEEEI